uniref:Uncharacterized protein n=1 Tax=viral metagenome TaxID=1070528 RepID=A0A6M3LAK1_9ZZZZ
MTLQDLIDRIDWSGADAAHEAWAKEKGAQADGRNQTRMAMLDGALYVNKCAACSWKGIRDETGKTYEKCPSCGAKTVPDWAGRMWARGMLAGIWDQAEAILKKEGLVLQGSLKQHISNDS